MAPKICDMILELPFSELVNSIQTMDLLKQKVYEAIELLKIYETNKVK
jgi:hypothetical protein